MLVSDFAKTSAGSNPLMPKKQLLAGLIALFSLLHMGQALSTTVSLESSTSAVSVGDTFTVDVLLTDATPGNVAAFNIDILYDTSLFDAQNVTFGTSFGLFEGFDYIAGDGPPVGAGAGTNIFQVSFLLDFELFPLQNPSEHPITLAPLPFGTIFLASLSFTAITAGNGAFSVGFLDISDALFPPGQVPTDPGNPTDPIVVLAVSAVPLPGAVWLMLSGLLAIGAIARKRVHAA
jgi:hypothetical protein